MAAKKSTTSKKRTSKKQEAPPKRSHARINNDDLRWSPQADEPTYKDDAFERWLETPDDTRSVVADMVEKHKDAVKPIALGTWRKWVGNFARGCANGKSNYPRIAIGRTAEIQRALKKTGGKLHPRMVKFLAGKKAS